MRQKLHEKIVNYILENQEKFYRLAYSYAGSQEDALDIVQNAVCRILENYEGIRNENAIRTWCYRIFVNESMTFLKRKAKEKPLDDDGEMEVPYIEKQFEAERDKEIIRREEDQEKRKNRMSREAHRNSGSCGSDDSFCHGFKYQYGICAGNQ